MKSLKVLVISVALVAMLVSSFGVAKAVDPVTLNAFALGSWIFNFFSTQPQKWQTSTGTIEVRIEVPEKYRQELGGVKYIFPLNQNGSDQQGWNLQLIAGWKTTIFAFFPQGERQIKKAYFRFDNKNDTTELKPPLSALLPHIEDTDDPHFVEIGVGTGRFSGGSISVMYRSNTLEGYYAEWLATKNLPGVFSNEYKKSHQGVAIVKILDACGQPTAGNFTVRIEGPEGAREGKVTIGQKTAQLGSATVTLEEDYTFVMNCIPQGSRVTFSREGKDSVTKDFFSSVSG